MQDGEIWDDFGLTQTMIGQNPGRSATDQYLSFAAQIAVPIITAYVIAQAAGWVNLAQGRVELVLAAPVSWSRLTVERLAATLVGALLVTAAGIGGFTIAATAVGANLDAAGLLRLIAGTVLLTAALAAVALVVVAGLRTTMAVTALALLYTASYLLVYLVPLFDWPVLGSASIAVRRVRHFPTWNGPRRGNRRPHRRGGCRMPRRHGYRTTNPKVA